MNHSHYIGLETLNPKYTKIANYTQSAQLGLFLLMTVINYCHALLVDLMKITSIHYSGLLEGVKKLVSKLDMLANTTSWLRSKMHSHKN
jgi:hypothetical protein